MKKIGLCIYKQNVYIFLLMGKILSLPSLEGLLIIYLAINGKHARFIISQWLGNEVIRLIVNPWR